MLIGSWRRSERLRRRSGAVRGRLRRGAERAPIDCADQKWRRSGADQSWRRSTFFLRDLPLLGQCILGSQAQSRRAELIGSWRRSIGADQWIPVIRLGNRWVPVIRLGYSVYRVLVADRCWDRVLRRTA